MKSSDATFLCLALMLLSMTHISAQTEKKLFSIGFNLGKMYPLGKSIIATEQNPDFGKPLTGSTRDFQVSYYLSESTRITGTLMVQSYFNQNMKDYLGSLITGYSLSQNRPNTLKSFTLGVQKSFYRNGRADYCFFINPNIGIERSRTIFDYLSFTNDSLALVISHPFTLDVRLDYHYSPYFNMGSGIELNFSKYFNFTVRGNYMVSNLGIENLQLLDNHLGLQLSAPDVNIGWVHRFSWSVGFSMNVYQNKPKKDPFEI